VAVSRTFPAFKDRSNVREAAELYRDVVSMAEKYIYIENQYLTSRWITEALSESLERPEGPEIVLVLPEESGGWLEKSTMDAIRFRVLKRLFEADRHRRLRLFHPTAENGDPIYVHAKVMIVDDRFVRIGSTNLSNRSMAFDSECDLAVEGDTGSPIEAGIIRFRNRLLAEHLGVTPDVISGAFGKSGSLIKTINAISTNRRALKPIGMEKDHLPVDAASLVKDPTLIDPEEPIAIDRMLDYFVEDGRKPSARIRWLKPILVLLTLAIMAAAWRWTPLSGWIEIDSLKAWTASARTQPLTVIWVVAGYVVGGVVMVPVTLMIGATVVAFSPLTGSLYALAGCLASAAVSYGIGAGIGNRILRHISGKRLNRLRKHLSEPGILRVAMARNIPVAPFTILNMIAGASRINLKDFILGTAVGMTPGIVAVSIFTDRVAAAVQEPSWVNIAVAAVVVILFGMSIGWFRKRLQ